MEESSSLDDGDSAEPNGCAIELQDLANDSHSSQQVSDSPRALSSVESSASGSTGTGLPASGLPLSLNDYDEDDVVDRFAAFRHWARHSLVDARALFDRFIGTYLLLTLVLFIFMILMTSWIMYLVSPMSYIDSLFTVTSAITDTGLVAFDTSQLRFAAQFLIVSLMLVGNFIPLSVLPLFLRLYRLQRLMMNLPKGADERTVRAKRNAIVLLIGSIFGYLVFWLVGASVFLIIYTRADSNVLDIYDRYNVQYVWGSIFLVVSSFCNAGFSPFALSMVQFSSEWVLLTVSGVLILVGNTMYPIVLRAWFLMLRVIFRKSDALDLIHRHSRLFYTHLFSFRQTMWLSFMVFGSLAVQFVLTTAMDFNYDRGELVGLSSFYKIWNSAYQSISTRTAGFNSVPIAASSSAVLILYVVMMFISSFPVATSVRSTTRTYAVSSADALMRLVIRDLLVVSLAWVTLAVVQYREFRDDSANFTSFSLLFEIVSAYGNVGLSLGYGSDVTSFCDRFNVLGKLVMILVMVLGRHRSIAESGDRALGGEHETPPPSIDFEFASDEVDIDDPPPRKSISTRKDPIPIERGPRGKSIDVIRPMNDTV